MLSYILRRAGLFLLALAVTTLVVFAVLRILPGDVAQTIGGIRATPEQLEQIRSAYGLDRPLAVQYLSWVSGLARGDLGDSLLTGSPIAGEVLQKLEVTLPLTLLAVALSVAAGLPLGIWAGLHAGRADGQAIGFLSQAAAAVPVLWAGLLLVVLLGRGVGLVDALPTQGFPREGWARPGAALESLVLPALTIAIVEGAAIVRFTRSAVLEALPSDYLRTAAAKGMTRTRALLRFGLPNVSLSILSVIALQAASMITGAIVVETLFDLPGVGSMLVADVASRDLVKVQSEVLLLVSLVLVVGLLVDVAHRLIDPRLRRQGARA
jgi:peptide/nickel transport system permease protein